MDGLGDNSKKSRREVANYNERRRMQNINTGFDQLRSVLPRDRHGDKMSKAAVLQHAYEMIVSLTEKNRKLEQELLQHQPQQNFSSMPIYSSPMSGNSPAAAMVTQLPPWIANGQSTGQQFTGRSSSGSPVVMAQPVAMQSQMAVQQGQQSAVLHNISSEHRFVAEQPVQPVSQPQPQPQSQPLSHQRTGATQPTPPLSDDDSHAVHQTKRRRASAPARSSSNGKSLDLMLQAIATLEKPVEMQTPSPAASGAETVFGFSGSAADGTGAAIVASPMKTVNAEEDSAEPNLSGPSRQSISRRLLLTAV